MRNVVKFALGLSVIAASFALARPASATRWRNLDTRNGTFFMGVSGGCTNTQFGCRIFSGRNIIVWQNSSTDGKNHTDQNWMVPGVANPSTLIGNTLVSMTPQLAGLSILNSSTAAGAQVVVRDIDPQVFRPDQSWEIKRAEDVQAPFTGCFILRNRNSSQVAGVSGGTLSQGQNVIQWALYLGTPNQGSVQTPMGWHLDQFWCPEADISFP
jgi:hypothetical protein